MLVLLALAASAPNLWVGTMHEPTKDIPDYIEQTRRLWRVPGLAVVIVHRGELIHQAGYGYASVEDQLPMTPQTIVPLGSCTKAFTAAIVASLHAEGKWNLNDPVRQHLPSFRLSNAEAEARITLRDLLAHRTGLGSNEYLWFKAPWSIEESVRRMRYLPQLAPLSTRYDYSTLNYLVVGQALEQMTAKPWAELLEERILKPLQIKSFATTTPSVEFGQKAVGYQRNHCGTLSVMPEYVLQSPNPAGSLYLPAEQIAPWMLANLQPSQQFKYLHELHQPQVLMPKSDAAIAAVYPDSQKIQYAMGWVRYDWLGEVVLGHGGILDGYRSQILLFPESQLGIALFANLHQTKINIALGHELAARILNRKAPRSLRTYFLMLEQAERSRKQNLTEQRIQLSRPDFKPFWPLERYTGNYEHVAFGSLKISKQTERLVWQWNQLEGECKHYQHEQFWVPTEPLQNELLEFRSLATGPAAVRFGGIVFVRSK